jgi:hypothetical protein
VVVCESGCLTRTAGALNNVLDVADLVCEISRYFLIVGVSGAVNLKLTESQFIKVVTQRRKSTYSSILSGHLAA